jgi:hypothetical protein
VQLVEILERPERGRELRTNALIKGEVHAHRFRDDQDVAENDGGINANEVERLQRDFNGKLWRPTHRQEIGRGAHGAILRQVPSSLAHHPYRGAFNDLTPECTQQQVIRR